MAITTPQITNDPAEMAKNRANLVASINDPNGTVAQMRGGKVSDTGGVVIPTTITSDLLNSNPTPVNIPKINSPSPTTLTVPTPANTNIDGKTGLAVTDPSTIQPVQEKSPTQTLLESLGVNPTEIAKTIASRGDVTTKLQNDLQLQTKTEDAKSAYNEYIQAKLDSQKRLEDILSRSGGLSGGAESEYNVMARRENANLANLAIKAQVAQGLVDSAQATIKTKIETQFQPLQDTIDFAFKFAQMNNNDPQVQAKAKRLEKEYDSVTKTSEDLHNNLLQNNAPQSVYTAIDKVTADYVSGKITAEEAQSKMRQVSGNYGISFDDQYKRAQINKIYNDARQALLTLPANVQTKVQTIAGQFDNETAVKNYQAIAESIDAVKNAGNSPTDDIQRIYAVAKVLDPSSAVKEGEYKTVEEYAQSLFQRTGKKIERVFDNVGFLTPEARNFIQTTLDNRLASSKKAYKNIYSEYGRRINKVTGRGDGTDYVTDYSRAFTTNSQDNKTETVTPEVQSLRDKYKY